MDYKKQAKDFADKYGVKLYILDCEYRKYFTEDTRERFVFKCKLQRGKKSYTFTLGQSITAGNEKPTMYDILACMTSYNPNSFEDFCGAFGYDTDSRSAERIWRACVKEWEAMNRLFPEEEVMNELQEIV